MLHLYMIPQLLMTGEDLLTKLTLQLLAGTPTDDVVQSGLLACLADILDPNLLTHLNNIVLPLYEVLFQFLVGGSSIRKAGWTTCYSSSHTRMTIPTPRSHRDGKTKGKVC